MSVAVDRAVALGAQEVLQQDLQRERQPRDVELLLEDVEAMDLVGAPTDVESVSRAKAVVRHVSPGSIYWGLPAVSQSHALLADARVNPRALSIACLMDPDDHVF